MAPECPAVRPLGGRTRTPEGPTPTAPGTAVCHRHRGKDVLGGGRLHVVLHVVGSMWSFLSRPSPLPRTGGEAASRLGFRGSAIRHCVPGRRFLDPQVNLGASPGGKRMEMLWAAGTVTGGTVTSGGSDLGG